MMKRRKRKRKVRRDMGMIETHLALNTSCESIVAVLVHPRLGQRIHKIWSEIILEGKCRGLGASCLDSRTSDQPTALECKSLSWAELTPRSCVEVCSTF
jgi:hypothetical protein